MFILHDSLIFLRVSQGCFPPDSANFQVRGQVFKGLGIVTVVAFFGGPQIQGEKMGCRSYLG